MALQSSDWLVIPRTCSNPRMRLVCFPHSGGGPSSFAKWPEFLDQFGIEIVAISAPGRERRVHVDPITDWEQLVGEICKALIVSRLVDDIPYAFFGHSFGAVVAYEVVRRLEVELLAGQPRPIHLCASAHPTPSQTCQSRVTFDSGLHLLDETAFLEAVNVFGFLPEGIASDNGLLQAVLPALRADLQMYEAYVPAANRELLALPITAFGGEQDVTVPREALEGWVQESCIASSHGAQLFPGGHFFLDQCRKDVLDAVRAQLEQSWAQLPLSLEKSAYEMPAIASSQCLHQIIAGVARENPLAEAIVDDFERLTYSELMSRVELVAMELQARFLHGEVGSVVGLLTPHDVTYVICQLAIWAAGGVLLFIEPHFPPELCQEICEQSSMRCAIASKEHVFKFQGIGGSAGTLELVGEGGWVPELAKLGTHAKLPSINVEQVALLAFTSGTSGKPKTIAGQHKFITAANYVKLQHWPFEEGVTDRLGCNVMFNWEVCQPLVHGLTTFIIPEDAAVDPQLFVSSLSKHRINRILTTPSLLSNVLQYCSQGLEERIPDMRMWQVCGEILPMQTVHKMQEFLPKCRIGNDYSTWETGDIAYGDPGHGAYEPSRNFAVAGIIATGRIAAIVDPETNKVVPHGCVGELYVAGHALSSGYYQQPDMTAEKFTDGFTDEMRAMWPGKWYRTGDSGRFIGKPPMLEVRGRVDSTVKIRGFKVGIPVVEAACQDIDGIAMCGVVPMYGAPGICECLCCFFQPGEGHDFEVVAQRMRTDLPRRLPRWMMPTFFRPLPENIISGGDTRKLDRKKLATLETLESLTASELNAQAFTKAESALDLMPTEESASGVRGLICVVWARALGLNVNALDTEGNFFDLGGHSMLAARIAAELNGDYGLPVTVLDIYSHSSLREFLDFVDPKGVASPVSPVTRRRRSSLLSSISSNFATENELEAPIAICGLAGRFPGADDTDALWQNLKTGTVSATFLSNDFLLSKGISEEIISSKEFVPCAYMINDADKFDNAFFGIGRHEATLMDPQHRVFMEVAHSAVENAALLPKTGFSDSVVGVFAAAGIDGYMVHHLDGAPLKNPMEPGDIFLGEIGSEKDYIATRVAYFMDFSGPAMNINSACSSALVACAQAAGSIVAGGCDAAIVGASAINFPNLGYRYQEGLVASPDGFVRPFDEGADGTVFGDAVGAALLRRMDDVRDSAAASLCWGAVRGFAVTNDGGQKAGYAAPSPVGQSRAVVSALEMMNTNPWSLSYVECHATGTRIGDGIETRGLMAAFKQAGNGPEKPVALGSVKGNIAHANCAAGITGLAKVLLMLRHRELVPTANFAKLNPKVNLEGTPFYVTTEASKWDAAGRPLRAGVSSFGIGGTNAHMIVEEAGVVAPIAMNAQESRPLASQMGFHIVPLSAKSVGSLQRITDGVCDQLRNADALETSVAAAVYTLQTGRSAYPLRKTFIVRANESMAVSADLTHAADVLEQGLPSEEELQDLTEAVKKATVAFVFPGQGSQYLGMAVGLYNKIPLFRRAVDRCCDLLQAPEMLAFDLRPLLFGVQGDSEQKELARPSRLQPSLFVVEYALAQLFLALSVVPVCVAGHSLGEYSAAVVGGLLSLEGALAVVAARANSTESLAGNGAMLSVVGWSDAELAEISNGKRSGLWLAGVNSPAHAVISGEVAAIDSLEMELKAHQRKCTRLHVTKAFHSGLVSEASAVLKGLGMPPEKKGVLVPVTSNYTGAWLSAQQLKDGVYWCNHMRGTVKWRKNAEQLMEKWAPTVVLEVGPGNALSTLTSKCVRADDTPPIFIQAMRHPKSDGIHDVEAFLGAVGQLWEAGVEINWGALHTELVGAPSLPAPLRLQTYAFERTSFWTAPERSVYVQGGLAESIAAAPPTLQLSQRSAPSFVRFIDRDGQEPMIRAYCLPFASGSSMLFAPWAQQVDSAVEVVAVELPGRGSHAEDRMPRNDADDDAILDVLCREILADLSGAQYVLVGCSMGGNLSMEVALRLARMKALAPLAVYIAGRKPPASDPSTVVGIKMSNEELADYAFAPPEVVSSPEFIEVVVPLLRADLELDARSERRLGAAALAGERLAPGIGLEAYCGTSDNIAPWTEANGWERFAHTPVGVHFFPGGHEFMSEHRPMLYANWRRDAIGRLVQRRTAEVTALAAHGFAQPGASLSPSLLAGAPPSEVKTTKLPLYAVQWDSVTASGQLPTAPQVFALNLGVTLTEETLAQTLQALRGGACILTKCATVSGVFSDSGDPLDEEVIQCWRFVRLVQHVLDNGMSGRVIVACPTAIGGSMVAGASKAVAMEAAELQVQRVFLPAEQLAESSTWLCALVDRFPEETDLWVDEGRVYAQRLEPMLEPRTNNDPCLPQYGNDGRLAVYVLTGATGGLGSAVVEWMLREQRLLPQQLVLLRRAASSPLTGVLSQCRVVEVASPDNCDSLISSALADIQGVVGIFHLAGVLDDGIVSGMTEERLRKVVTPKCGIAMALLRAAAELQWPVQWLVGFSSTSSLFGYAGQTNYCAANAVLDNLATFGAAKVLPEGDRPPCRIITINWGPWGEAGMAKVGTKAYANAVREGDTPLSNAVALRCLATALRTASQAQLATVQFCACDMEWDKSQWSGIPTLKRIQGVQPPRAVKTADVAAVKTISPRSIQRKAIEEFVEQQANGAAFLKIHKKTLPQIGFDSLEMVQFRNAFNKRFGVNVPLGLVADPSRKLGNLAEELGKFVNA